MMPRAGVACHICRSTPPIDDMRETFDEAIDVAVARWNFRRDVEGRVGCGDCVDEFKPTNLIVV